MVKLGEAALWIAKQADLNPDDVYDVLLGNITKPESLVSEVEMYFDEYNEKYKRGTAKLD